MAQVHVSDAAAETAATKADIWQWAVKLLLGRTDESVRNRHTIRANV